MSERVLNDPPYADRAERFTGKSEREHQATPIKVEQVDRECAASMCNIGAEQTEIRAGIHDGRYDVLNCARHRITAEAKALETAARLAEHMSGDWRWHPMWRNAAIKIATAIRSRIPEIKA